MAHEDVEDTYVKCAVAFNADLAGGDAGECLREVVSFVAASLRKGGLTVEEDLGLIGTDAVAAARVITVAAPVPKIQAEAKRFGYMKNRKDGQLDTYDTSSEFDGSARADFWSGAEQAH
jgi:hypothetical protein